MAEQSLKDFRILVVEDEYLIADDLRKALTEAGAVIIGPVPAVDEALELVRSEGRIDAAVLDVNLRGEMIFPVADALAAQGVPFVFTTGYDRGALPGRFAESPRIEKPLKAEKLVATLLKLLNPPGGFPGN
jgi:CheY-like chemotaxis protein